MCVCILTSTETSCELFQVIFPTRPCLQQEFCRGFREFFATLTIPASAMQLRGNLQESCPITTTPCKSDLYQSNHLLSFKGNLLCSNYHDDVLCRLARFYSDVQELLFSDAEFQQLGRLWQEASDFSNFMDTLRKDPGRATGTKYYSLSSANVI